MTYASVGWRLPLDGLTRSAHRDWPNCFQADSPSACRSTSPSAGAVSGAAMAPGSYKWLYVAGGSEYPCPFAEGAGYSANSGDPVKARNGRGCDAQSRYPSDRAKALK